MISTIGLDMTRNASDFRHLQNLDDGMYSHILGKIRKRIQKPCILLLTCDRAELYIEGTMSSPEIFERALSLNIAKAKASRYSMCGKDAMMHLFLLASGVLSPLFGEDAILSQLLHSLDIARDNGSSSPCLSRLFNMAIAFGKRMQSEYKLDDFDLSIAQKIASMIEKGSNILIIGCGFRSKMLAELLKSDNRVVMTLRDSEKTFLLPIGVESIAYDERRNSLDQFDVVISATYGLYHTFEDVDLPLFAGKKIFDLAPVEDLPSSFDAIKISDIDGSNSKRDKLVDAISKRANDETGEFIRFQKKAEKAPGIDLMSESFSYEVVRRMQCQIDKLDVGNCDKKAFLDALYDSVRKAYIAFEFSKKNP